MRRTKWHDAQVRRRLFAIHRTTRRLCSAIVRRAASATCRHIAYNLTRKAPGKDSIRLRRKTAGWDDEYLAGLIAA
ncbi:MAG: hypothetical protein ACREDC_03235 [Bradyrhizobium sp.]